MMHTVTPPITIPNLGAVLSILAHVEPLEVAMHADVAAFGGDGACHQVLERGAATRALTLLTRAERLARRRWTHIEAEAVARIGEHALRRAMRRAEEQILHRLMPPGQW